MDSRGCYPPQHPRGLHQTPRSPPCPALDCKAQVLASCKRPDSSVEGEHCKGVCPPKVKNEIVVFRKRYKCSASNKTQSCDKDCPFIQTVQYIIEPFWEQLDCAKCDDAVITTLDGLPFQPLACNSSLAHCLQCNFDKCEITEQEPRNCDNSKPS